MIFVTAIFAEVLAPNDPYEISQRCSSNSQHCALVGDRRIRPGSVLPPDLWRANRHAHRSGAPRFVGATGGSVLGVISAYLGGKVDLIGQRVMDVMLAFRLLILALAIVSVLGRSCPWVLAIAIPIILRTTALSAPAP